MGMLFNQHFCWKIDDVRNQSGLTSLSVVGDVLHCLRAPQTPTPENATCDTDKNVVSLTVFVFLVFLDGN